MGVARKVQPGRWARCAACACSVEGQGGRVEHVCVEGHHCRRGDHPGSQMRVHGQWFVWGRHKAGSV